MSFKESYLVPKSFINHHKGLVVDEATTAAGVNNNKRTVQGRTTLSKLSRLIENDGNGEVYTQMPPQNTLPQATKMQKLLEFFGNADGFRDKVYTFLVHLKEMLGSRIDWNPDTRSLVLDGIKHPYTDFADIIKYLFGVGHYYPTAIERNGVLTGGVLNHRFGLPRGTLEFYVFLKRNINRPVKYIFGFDIERINALSVYSKDRQVNPNLVIGDEDVIPDFEPPPPVPPVHAPVPNDIAKQMARIAAAKKITREAKENSDEGKREAERLQKKERERIRKLLQEEERQRKLWHDWMLMEQATNTPLPSSGDEEEEEEAAAAGVTTPPATPPENAIQTTTPPPAVTTPPLTPPENAIQITPPPATPRQLLQFHEDGAAAAAAASPDESFDTPPQTTEEEEEERPHVPKFSGTLPRGKKRKTPPVDAVVFVEKGDDVDRQTVEERVMGRRTSQRNKKEPDYFQAGSPHKVPVGQGTKKTLKSILKKGQQKK